ncbi:MAG: urea ABC transporter permease subunit UrtB [Gammaproteobacteria bacterium]|nr:urea ABC transporter permease subunit UrtB [Gammaproteobacteria bacterium]
MGLLVLLVLLVVSMRPVYAADAAGKPEDFAAMVGKLVTDDFDEKQDALAQLTRIDHPQLLNTFRHLLNGELYYIKADKRVVYAEDTDKGYQTYDVITGEKLQVMDKSDLRKIGINNRMRTMLGIEIAKLSLHDKDPAVRLKAVKEMVSSLDADSIKLLREQQTKEQDARVKEAIDVGLALADLNSSDQKTRLAAIELLSSSLLPEVKVALDQLVQQYSNGQYIEKDPQVREAAKKALGHINGKIDLYNIAQTTFFGLSLGSVLLLSAIGLAITFGVMGVINMAHGEMMMLGAYTTYLIQAAFPNLIDYSLLMAIPAAFVVSGLFGIAIERGVIRLMYGRPLDTLLATFGISLLLQQLVRTTISAQNVTVSTPSWMSGSWQINPVFALTYNRLYIIFFSIIVFLALLFILKKTVLGLQVRAVSQNRDMAKAMGVRSEWVDAMTFGLGSGIAGIAGVALSQLTNVGPNLGQSYIIDSFMVVVFGGVGNLWGTLVGGLSLGVVNKFIEPWTGAVLAKILVLVFVILFIQKRPRGLFPQKGRAAES